MNESDDAHPHSANSNDEILLNDIRKTASATTVSGVDVRSLAIQAVEQYWIERDKGLIDRDGMPLDESSALHRIALARFASPRSEFLMELLVTVGPSLLLSLLLWTLFSGGWTTFELGQYVVPLIGVLIALWGLTIGTRFMIRPVPERNIGQGPLHHIIGATVGGLVVASLLLWSTEWQQRKARQLANQESRDATLALAQDKMLDVSRVTFERLMVTRSFEKAALEPRRIGLTNRKQLKVQTEQVTANEIVYRGETDDVPGSLVATIAKNSGSLKVITEEGSVEGMKFFVGTVEEVTDDRLTLKLLGESGEQINISLSLNNWVEAPDKGETVFVATNPEANAATQIVGL